jgi:hypothetical protein
VHRAQPLRLALALAQEFLSFYVASSPLALAQEQKRARLLLEYCSTPLRSRYALGHQYAQEDAALLLAPALTRGTIQRIGHLRMLEQGLRAQVHASCS